MLELFEDHYASMRAAGLKRMSEADLAIIDRAVEYAQDEELLTMHLKYDGKIFDVRDSDNLLSLKLAQNAAQSISHTVLNEDGFTNLVTVKIK